MLGLKLAIAFGVLTLVGTIGTGAYLYYKESQDTIASLHAQAATLEVAVDIQKDAIESLQKDIEEQSIIKEEVLTQIESARKDVETLQTKMVRHDLKAIAAKKASLLEKKINRASNDIMRCFEIVSGSKVGQDETNNQCKDLLTSTSSN